MNGLLVLDTAEAGRSVSLTLSDLGLAHGRGIDLDFAKVSSALAWSRNAVSECKALTAWGRSRKVLLLVWLVSLSSDTFREGYAG